MQKLLALGFRLRQKPYRASHRTFCLPDAQKKEPADRFN